MRRFIIIGTAALIATAWAAAIASPALATGDANTRKACLAAEALASGLDGSTSVDATDRQQLTTVAQRLAHSPTKGASALGAKTKRGAKAKVAAFTRAVDAVNNWCADHAVLVAATTTSTTPPTTIPPTTTTTRPSLTPEQAEFIFKSGATTPSYDELVKNPQGTGQAVYFRAKVFQYDTNTGLTSMLVYVTPGSYDFWSDVVLVNLPSADAGNGIDNNDIVDLWGTPAGAYSYTTRAGGTNTVPKITAKYVTLVSKG
jgi:hypothetical protein